MEQLTDSRNLVSIIGKIDRFKPSIKAELNPFMYQCVPKMKLTLPFVHNVFRIGKVRNWQARGYYDREM